MSTDYRGTEGLLLEVKRVFGDDGIHWSCLGNHGEKKLEALIRLAAPELVQRGRMNIVEIGTHQGVSSVILARYGDVTTFDTKAFDLRDKVWEQFGVRDCMTPILTQGDPFTASVLENMEFDLAFIDGCHEIANVKANFEAVQKCGRVIFHDYEPRLHGERTVKFVDGLRDGRTTKLIPFALWEGNERVYPWEVPK